MGKPVRAVALFWRIFVAAAALFTLSDCAVVGGFQVSPESSEVTQARRTTYYGMQADAAYYAPGADRQKIRNELVYGKMQVLEDDFLDFERTLTGSATSISAGTGLTQLVLDGLGATTGNATTKSALAAASAGVVGAQGVVNKDLYYEKTLPALISQMQANRESVRLTIIKNLAQSDDAYPLNAAEIDLKKLEAAGSLVGAVNQISQQSTNDKKLTDAEIAKQVRTLKFDDGPTANKLQAWLYIDGKVNQDHFDALQSWLNLQPEGFLKNQGYPPGAFVSGDTADARLEPIRKRALADPVLNIPN